MSNIDLESITAEGGAVGLGDVIIDVDHPIEQAGGDPVFGAVAKEATGVELKLEDGTPPIPAQIVPLPPSMPFNFDVFFASNPFRRPAHRGAAGYRCGRSVGTGTLGPGRGRGSPYRR